MGQQPMTNGGAGGAGNEPYHWTTSETGSPICADRMMASITSTWCRPIYVGGQRAPALPVGGCQRLFGNGGKHAGDQHHAVGIVWAEMIQRKAHSGWVEISRVGVIVLGGAEEDASLAEMRLVLLQRGDRHLGAGEVGAPAFLHAETGQLVVDEGRVLHR
jgi:hypothetical protein